MTINKLLGKSIHSHELIAFLEQFKISNNINVNKTEWEYSLNNEQLGIELEFFRKDIFAHYFGDKDIGESSNGNELFLKAINIDINFNKAQSAIELPCQLEFGMDEESMIKTIGFEELESWFYFDNWRLLCSFEENKLCWLGLMLLEETEILANDFRKNLINQNENIKIENVESIQGLTIELPTIEWLVRKNEGDDIFTDENLGATKDLLEKYLNELYELALKKDAVSIYELVKSTVYSLNELQEKYDGYIETLEREELCDFINNSIKTTGIIVDERVDLTWPMRDW